MNNVSLKNRPIKATCAYCGSNDVGIDRQPYWDSESNTWKVRPIMPTENYLMRFKGKEDTASPYNRAYCLTCEGDTDIRFDIAEDPSFSEAESYYKLKTTERVSNDDGTVDVVHFSQDFENLTQVDEALSKMMWDDSVNVQICKVACL